MRKVLKLLVFLITFFVGINFLFNKNVYATESVDLSYYMENSDEIYDINTLDYTGYNIDNYKDGLLGSGIEKINNTKIKIIGDDPIINIIKREYFLTEGSGYVSGNEYSYYYITTLTKQKNSKEIEKNIFMTDICIIDSDTNISGKYIETQNSTIEEKLTIQQYRFYAVDETRFLPSSYNNLNTQIDIDDKYVIIPEIKWRGTTSFGFGETKTFKLENFYGISTLRNNNIKRYNDGLFFISSDVKYEGYNYIKPAKKHISYIELVMDSLAPEIGDSLLNIGVSLATTGLSSGTSGAVSFIFDFIINHLEDVMNVRLNKDNIICQECSSNDDFVGSDYSAIMNEQMNLYGGIIKTISAYSNNFGICEESDYVDFCYKYSITDQTKSASDYSTRINICDKFDILYSQTFSGYNTVYEGATINKTFDVGNAKKCVNIGYNEMIYSISNYVNELSIVGSNQYIDIDVSRDDIDVIVKSVYGYTVKKTEKGYYLYAGEEYIIELYNYSTHDVEYNVSIKSNCDGETITLDEKVEKIFTYVPKVDGWYYCDTPYNLYILIDNNKSGELAYLSANKIYIIRVINITQSRITEDIFIRKIETATIEKTGNEINVLNLSGKYMAFNLDKGTYAFSYDEDDVIYTFDGKTQKLINVEDLKKIEQLSFKIEVNGMVNPEYLIQIIGNERISIRVFCGNDVIENLSINVSGSKKDNISYEYKNHILSFNKDTGEQYTIIVIAYDTNFRFNIEYISKETFDISYNRISGNKIYLDVNNVPKKGDYDYYYNGKWSNQKLDVGNSEISLSIPIYRDENFYRNLYVTFICLNHREVTFRFSNIDYDLRKLYFQEDDEGYYLINTVSDFKYMLNTYEYTYCTYDDGINNDTIEVWGNVVDGILN